MNRPRRPLPRKPFRCWVELRRFPGAVTPEIIKQEALDRAARVCGVPMRFGGDVRVIHGAIQHLCVEHIDHKEVSRRVADLLGLRGA